MELGEATIEQLTLEMANRPDFMGFIIRSTKPVQPESVVRVTNFTFTGSNNISPQDSVALLRDVLDGLEKRIQGQG